MRVSVVGLVLLVVACGGQTAPSSKGTGAAPDMVDAAPCAPGLTFCVEGCFPVVPQCVSGSCAPHAACLSQGHCPAGQFACQPCPNVAPACVDPSACVPVTCPDE